MSIHKSVLLKETVELLNIKKGYVVVDATLGSGGHAREILRIIGDGGKLIAIDSDINAIEKFIAEIPNSKFQIPNNFQNSKFEIKNSGNIYLVNGNFADLKEILEAIEIESANAILADLGWSSDQLEGRGMSFLKDERLDMRLSLRITNQYEYANNNLNAEQIVNNYSEKELVKIIQDYGEERYARNIVRKIIEYRRNKKIKTTKELAEIIKSVAPLKYRYGKIHPATKTFQALRIEVNRELDNLKKFLPEAVEALEIGGRMAVISFHSLEDRIVKNIFRENARGRILTDEITGQKIVKEAPVLSLITRKPILPKEKEIGENPRSRSAKLRVAEKINPVE